MQVRNDFLKERNSFLLQELSLLLIMNTASRVLTSHHNHMEEQSDELSRTSPNTELARILGNSIQPWGLEG